METKIECSIFNHLLKSISANSNNFIVNGVDNWDYFQNSDQHKVKYQETNLRVKIQTSMNRMLEKMNLDSIKNTMKIHEDIFKYQVKELHRLYSVQKMLMNELNKEIKQSRLWNNPISANLNANHSQLINWQNSATREINSREHSGSCSGDNVKILRGFYQSTDQSSQVNLKDNNKMSIQGSSDDIDTNEVELTLSIGTSSSSKNKETKELDSSVSFKGDREGYNAVTQIHT